MSSLAQMCITEGIKYLVWIRTDDTTDELYRVAGAESLDEALAVIAGAGVSLDRICVTQPLAFRLDVNGGS
jgi:hypothetical protein